MARRERSELLALRDEERIAGHQQRGDALLRDGFESRLELAIGPGP